MKITNQIRNQLLLLVLALLAFACEDQALKDPDRNEYVESSSEHSASRWGHSRKSVYVIVPGAWHPESSWHDIKWMLEQAGHRVETVELPGLGNDKTPVETVTFQNHVDAVKRVVNKQTRPVILIGHSYGGAVISQVGEDLSRKIDKLVYISGQMPANGETIAQWALADTASLVTKNLLVDGPVAYMTNENYGKAMYNVALTSNPVTAWKAKKIIARLRPHPLATLFEPLHLSDNYDNLEKVYISCLKDKAVTPQAQRNMYTRFPGIKVYFLRGADHSPAVSTPLELVGILKR